MTDKNRELTDKEIELSKALGFMAHFLECLSKKDTNFSIEYAQKIGESAAVLSQYETDYVASLLKEAVSHG